MSGIKNDICSRCKMYTRFIVNLPEHGKMLCSACHIKLIHNTRDAIDILRREFAYARMLRLTEIDDYRFCYGFSRLCKREKQINLGERHEQRGRAHHSPA